MKRVVLIAVIIMITVLLTACGPWHRDNQCLSGVGDWTGCVPANEESHAWLVRNGYVAPPETIRSAPGYDPDLTSAAAQQQSAPASQPAAPTPVQPVIAPITAFCQLGVTQLTDGVPTQSLAWDPTQLRGYMDDRLAKDIQTGPAYCRTVFPQQVTLLFDAIASNPYVDGRSVQPGNGVIYTGTTFEWIYKGPSVSNGHAYIVQKP